MTGDWWEDRFERAERDPEFKKFLMEVDMEYCQKVRGLPEKYCRIYLILFVISLVLLAISAIDFIMAKFD